MFLENNMAILAIKPQRRTCSWGNLSHQYIKAILHENINPLHANFFKGNSITSMLMLLFKPRKLNTSSTSYQECCIAMNQKTVIAKFRESVNFLLICEMVCGNGIYLNIRKFDLITNYCMLLISCKHAHVWLKFSTFNRWSWNFCRFLWLRKYQYRILKPMPCSWYLSMTTTIKQSKGREFGLQTSI